MWVGEPPQMLNLQTELKFRLGQGQFLVIWPDMGGGASTDGELKYLD